MTLFPLYHRTLHLLVLLGIVCHSVANEDATFLLLAAPFVAASWLLGGSREARPLPRWLVGAMLLGATAHMIFSWAGDIEDTIGVLARYVIVLQAIKLFDCRAARDRAQIIGLSFMLVVAAMLSSVTLQTGVTLLLYLPVLTIAVMLHQVHAGAERTPGVAAAPAPTAGAPARRRARRDLRRLGVLSMTGAVALGTVVFIAMPRGVGANMLGAYKPPSFEAAVTGFRDTVQLGESGFITLSQRPVLTLKLGGPGARARAGRPVYLRGAVLDRYDPERRRWSRRASDAFEEYRLFPAAELGRSGGVLSITQEIELRPTNAEFEYLFSMLRPVRVESEAARRVRVDPVDRTMTYSIRGGWRRPLITDAASTRRITVVSDPYYREVVRSTWIMPYGSMPMNPFRAGPIHDHAMEVLRASRLTTGGIDWEAQDKSACVAALRDSLQREHRYSLEMIAPPQGVDPIEAFLFRTKQGHCEYFASALAALCMSVGIPARYVTGYLATEYDASTGVYTVRESDAHAWVEAEVQPGLWREFDASPASDLQRLHNPGFSLTAAWQRLLGALELAWSEGVVSYDRTAQAETLGGSIDPFGMLARLERWLKAREARRESAARDDQGGWLTRAAWAGAGVLGLAAFAALALLVLPAGRRARDTLLDRARDAILGLRRPGERPAIALAAMHRALWRALARRGFARPPGVPGLAFVAEIEPRDPPAARAARRIIELHYAARFGGRTPARAEIDDARALLAAVASRRP